MKVNVIGRKNGNVMIKLLAVLLTMVLVATSLSGLTAQKTYADEQSQYSDDVSFVDIWTYDDGYTWSSDVFYLLEDRSEFYFQLEIINVDASDRDGFYLVMSNSNGILVEKEFEFLDEHNYGGELISIYEATIVDMVDVDYSIGDYMLTVYDGEDKIVAEVEMSVRAIEESSPTSNYVSPWVVYNESVQFYNISENYIDFDIINYNPDNHSRLFAYSCLVFNADNGNLLYVSPEVINSFTYVDFFLYPSNVGRSDDFDFENNNYLIVFLDSAGNIWAYGFTDGATSEVDLAQDELESIYNEYIAGLSEEEMIPNYQIQGVNTDYYLNVDEVINFVTRNYELVLGRSPDETGLYNWVNSLCNFQNTGVHVAYGFFFSQEYLNMNTSNEEFVTTLYNVFLDREPDAQGMENWVGQLEAGASREQVFAGVANSREFYDICLSYGITAGHYMQGVPLSNQQNVNAFVARLYSIALGRIGDYSGQENWVRQLVNGTNSGAGVAYGFFFSPEFTESYGNYPEQYVTTLYYVMLGRTPDQAGFDSWVHQIYTGTDRISIFRGFVYSQEFSNICEAYGINRGTI